jgi:carboxyl-terminal processing protease
MKTKKMMILLCLAFAVTTVNAQQPDSVKTYIDSALQIMQTRSLYAKHLDWKKIRDSVYLRAGKAKNYSQIFPALSYAFFQLKDDHGMVAGPDTFARYPSHINFDKLNSAGLKKRRRKVPGSQPRCSLTILLTFRVPTMIVNRQKAMDLIANQLRDSLCMLAAQHPRGFIIDLRINNGGNSAPMLSGLGPLFHLNILGYGVSREGQMISPVRMLNGIVLDDQGKATVDIKNSCKIDPTVPIAILFGSSTTSSAEITAAFLKQQPHTRSFGEPTPGFCSATEGFLFGRQQGYLLLTVNRIADAKKHVYRDLVVRPDVLINSKDDNFDDLNADPTVKAALLWLAKKFSRSQF